MQATLEYDSGTRGYMLNLPMPSGGDQPLICGQTGLPVIFTEGEVVMLTKYNTGPAYQAIRSCS